MRTRFLNTDYFTSSSSPIETLSFLNLPVPRLSPSRLSTCSDEPLRFGSVLDISLEIEQLPIDSALSKFYSEVLPQAIDVDYSDFEAPRFPTKKCCDEEKESDNFYEEKEDESSRTFRSESLEKDTENAVDDKNKYIFEVIQFETPELPVFVENACLSEKEEIWIASEVPEIDNNLDVLKRGLAIQYPNEIQESVYSVEDVALDYHVGEKTYILEDDGLVPDEMRFTCCTFPLFEVDEISLGILTSHSMEEKLLSVLENTEHQPLTQNENLLISGKEILGSMEYDILDLLSDHSLSKQCLESELTSANMLPEMGLISMVESSQLIENPEFNQVEADGDYFLSMSPMIFQEFQIFDVDSSKLFEEFFSTQTTSEPVTCDWMFRDDMNFRNFNELIISHELALVDDTFKSLPIPVLSDGEKIKSMYAVIEEKLAELQLQPLSASDGIYLDWYLLEEDNCSCKKIYSQQKLLEEIGLLSIDLDLASSDVGKLAINFIFSDDSLSGPNMEGCKESLNFDSDGISMLDSHLMGVASGKLLHSRSPKPGNGELSAENKAERASLLFKSMSQFNDLDFFLNPQKVITGVNGESTVKKLDTTALSGKSMEACVSNGIQLQQWNITLYKVKLSDNIVALIDIFEKRYLAIVQNETELKSFGASDGIKLLSLPQQQLMDCFSEKLLQKTPSDENIMAYIALSAIKQMAWYTCFYGIHAACLYVDKLCQSQDYLKSRLGSLQSLIVDADGKVDKEITSSHPSLPVIQGILRSNTSQSNFKVLILAEQVFWGSIKSLLMSMGLSYNELQNFTTHADQPDMCSINEFANAKMDALLISDCLLVSHGFVSASFPFNKFSLILEYGGSYDSSRISALSPKLAALPHLHFLWVELSDSSVCRALCDGIDMPQNMEVEGERQSTLTADEHMCAQKLQELLKFVPVEGKCYMGSLEAADKVEACSMPSSVPCFPCAMGSEHIQQSMVSYPNAIIIVNTQTFDKEMIVSRRSTYQKILAMEKQGVQVVERDSDLPVDVIISSGTCLVWYDSKNIGKKATASDEASSCVPLCVENIATNVLTLLSYTFSACFLIFEGEVNFISTVMESSDGLYAAAASLGIDIQLFFSYTSDLTDEIILSCIGCSIKLTRGLYPKMPESETLAESFLTKFPSVNPLTAHAMLSSGRLLIEFLECSHERRISAIQKYYVPDESIILFSALCKYGEREDSKSIMTDCSSSVSSGPDSDKYRFKIDSERKRQKCIYNPHKIDMQKDNLLLFEPLNQFNDVRLNPSGGSSWKDQEISDEFEKPSSSLNDLFGKTQLDFDMMMEPSRVSEPYDSQILEGPQSLSEIKNPILSLKDKLLGQNKGSEDARMNNLSRLYISKSNNPRQDLMGEVIDLTCSPLSGEDFSSVPNSLRFSPSVPGMEKNSMRKSNISRRLSFDKSSHPTFPTAAEINYGSNILASAKDPRKSLHGSNDHPDTYYDNDRVPFQEEITHYGGTRLSNAVRSTHPQPGSPWTIEFLNRIREKSRLRQQSLPSDTNVPCFRTSGISKVTKRRSPSILDFFKYQGGSNSRKLPEQKKKRSIQSSTSSKNKRPSASFPTWTPIDKKARQTLSFAMNGSGSQTKLVWSDGNAHGPSKKFQNQ